MSGEWLEITLHSKNTADIERLEQALEAAGAVAVTYQAGDEEEIYEPPVGEMPLWQNTGVTGLFAQDSDPEVITFLLHAALGEDYPIQRHLFADSEWTRVWLKHFRPIAFGKNFWVAACEHVIEDKDAVVLRLDPGLAFGTGTHPSTALCLDYLVNHAAVAGKTVFDYGCGSGILGIACALLGARHVWQTDIDPQALTAARNNAVKNGVQAQISVCGNPDDAPKTDILVANILLKPLCLLKTQFAKHTGRNSCLLFSGLLERQETQIRQVYNDDYHIKRVNQRDGWILLELRPRNQ